jgi:hypothetical protein
MTSVMAYFCMKKVSLFFPSLICRIRDKRRSDPDPGYGIPKNGRIRVRDKHPGSATLVLVSEVIVD